MEFDQFKAKVFMLSVWEEFDQLPSTSKVNEASRKIGNKTIFEEGITELIQEFGVKELEGLKILARFIK